MTITKRVEIYSPEGFLVYPRTVADNTLINNIPGLISTDVQGALSEINSRILPASDIALLPGRGGGQTLIGGTAASENLILQSTAHATRGQTRIGGTLNVDEVNAQVGIGTTSPVASLQIVGASVEEPSEGIFRIGSATTNFRLGCVEGQRSWIQSHASLPLHINRLGNDVVFNLNAGNVGVGVAPATKLHVEGTLRTSGFQLGTSATANHVLTTNASGVGTWQALSADNISAGTLAVARGGTGIASYTTGNYVRASGATTLEQRTPAQVLGDIGAAASSHGNHVPTTQTANNAIFLRNDNSWQTVTPANIGAALTSHGHSVLTTIPHLGIEATANIERGPSSLLWAAIASGHCVYPDEEFASGSNSVSVYNNSGGSGVTHTRRAEAAAPNRSGQIIEISHSTDATSPDHGGFVQAINSRRNAIFVQRFRARLPVGYQFNNYANSMGTNAQWVWLTSRLGTGKYEDYALIIYCGNSGTFSNGGHIAVSGGTKPFVWQLAGASVFEIGSRIHDASAITSGTLPVDRGGTGIASYTTGNYTRASGATTLEQRTPAQVLTDIGALGSAHNVTTAGVHGSATTATANTLIHRDANGRAQVVDGAAASDIATRGQIDAHSTITTSTSTSGHIRIGNGFVVEGGITRITSAFNNLVSVTSSRALVLTDADMVLSCSSASPIALTVSPDSTTNFPIGTEIGIVRYGAGNVTCAAGSGVTLRSRSGFLSLSPQFASAALKKIAANEWMLVGALA